jgi:hypothetical protein
MVSPGEGGSLYRRELGRRELEVATKLLLGVTLRAKPRDLAFPVHPLIDLGLARETGDFSWFQARVFRDDFPIIFGVALWAKGYFCFCHGALCTISTQKEKPRGGRGLSIG